MLLKFHVIFILSPHVSQREEDHLPGEDKSRTVSQLMLWFCVSHQNSWCFQVQQIH